MGIKKEEGGLYVRNSRKVYIIFYVMILFLFGTIFYIIYRGKSLHPLALPLVIFFAVFILLATEIHRLGNLYHINRRSIIHNHGYFSISSRQLEFAAISDSNVRQNLWQRLFNYGTIEIHLFSRENTAFIKNIDRPYIFVEFLQRKMRNLRGGMGR
ncbi:MAG: PH domain-containing protein [Nanoarchaeota archaeon]